MVDTALASKDLLVCETVAAFVDDAVFAEGAWRFPDATRRTVHHVTGGQFLATGELLVAKGAKKRP